jgi:hypothetical protein
MQILTGSLLKSGWTELLHELLNPEVQMDLLGHLRSWLASTAGTHDPSYLFLSLSPHTNELCSVWEPLQDHQNLQYSQISIGPGNPELHTWAPRTSCICSHTMLGMVQACTCIIPKMSVFPREQSFLCHLPPQISMVLPKVTAHSLIQIGLLEKRPSYSCNPRLNGQTLFISLPNMYINFPSLWQNH